MTILKEFKIIRPDDWHLHVRDGAMLRAVAPYSKGFGRAIIMPNLVPPVVTVQDAIEYHERILSALPRGSDLIPLMTLYLTEDTDPADVARGGESGLIEAVKLYPAGATTNSASGVRDFAKVLPVLETMAEIGLPLCVHGEVTDPEVDIFDREAVFIERVLEPIRKEVPTLKVVMEHITTKDGVDYVREGGPTIAGTITVQHLMLDRNNLLVGGMRPHYYCLPVLKRRMHREALLEAATSGNPSFFLGSDSAPHATDQKESACCSAGCFTAPVAIPILAHLFEEQGAPEKLESFTSVNGALFYNQPLSSDEITLVKYDKPVEFIKTVNVEGGDTITVFDPGVPIHWDVVD